MRGPRWLASALRSFGTSAAAVVLNWWCHCAVNQLGDRAGSYRRIAACLAVLPAPLIVAALGSLLAPGPASIGPVVVRVLVAITCGWLAWDLIRHASAHGLDGSPHTSSIALVGGIVLLGILVAREDAAAGFGPQTLLVIGLVFLTGGYVVMAAAMRHHDRLLSMVGRAIMVLGAALVGAMELGRATLTVGSAPIEAAGLGLVAVALLLTAAFEARLLVRGAALYWNLARR